MLPSWAYLHTLQKWTETTRNACLCRHAMYRDLLPARPLSYHARRCNSQKTFGLEIFCLKTHGGHACNQTKAIQATSQSKSWEIPSMPQEPWPFGLPALSYVLILASAKAEHKPFACMCWWNHGVDLSNSFFSWICLLIRWVNLEGRDEPARALFWGTQHFHFSTLSWTDMGCGHAVLGCVPTLHGGQAGSKLNLPG